MSLTIAGFNTPEEVVKAVYPKAYAFLSDRTGYTIYPTPYDKAIGRSVGSEAGAWIDAASNILIDQDPTIKAALDAAQRASKGSELSLTLIEHAIEHLPDSDTSAVSVLLEAYKAIGPLGQTPSWERSKGGR
jgi:hypothetical protein